MNYPVDQKLWVAAQNAPISDEDLARLTNLVHPDQRYSEKRCVYEVVVFHTEQEWNNANVESEIKKRIWAKFRIYYDAEHYAQRLLLSPNPYYFKVILRR